MDMACLFLQDLALAPHLCGRCASVIDASPPLLLEEYLATMAAASLRPCHCDTCSNTYGYELEDKQCKYCRAALSDLMAHIEQHNIHESQPGDTNAEVRFSRMFISV